MCSIASAICPTTTTTATRIQRRSIVAALACITLVSASCPVYPDTVPLNINDPSIKSAISDIDALFTKAVVSEKLPSLVSCVVYDQEILFCKGYGKQNPFNATSLPTNEHTPVRLASLTKVFTDLMMFTLRDAGKVSLEDPLTKHIPGFKVLDPYNTNRPITLRQLASHTSGLQREIPCLWNSQGIKCSEDEILERLQSRYLVLPQYERPHYSNLGLAMLGRALEKVTGKTYESFVEENILGPLQMDGCTFDYEKIKQTLAVGIHDGTAVPIENLGWGNPMGGMFCSAHDEDVIP